MFEQLGTIHPLLPPGVGLLALLTGAIIIDLIVKQILVRAARVFAKRSSGTFPAYTWNYLKHHPKTHQGMTLMAIIPLTYVTDSGIITSQ